MSSHITHSHTTHLKKSHKDSGFTLIELLVVISIIALLSTIVLAVVQDARVKARNTAKNNLVLEYVKALELYRSDNESYPVTIATDSEGGPAPICFGYDTDENCWAEGYSGSNEIKQIVQTYLSENFAHRDSILINNANFKGVLYQCTGINYICNQYSLTWILEKQVSNCVAGATPNPGFPGNNTHCTYPEVN
jgi:prepilin-type N-terminal cleavage/methylation domain-containing protein